MWTKEQASRYRVEWGRQHPERVRKIRKRYWKKNKTRILSKLRKWRKDHPKLSAKKERRAMLFKRYKMREQEYNHLLKKQKGGCAICGAKPKKYNLAVDHCHETGRIRGLLCSPCNAAIGRFGDTIHGVRRVLSYLNAEEMTIR